MATVYSGGCAIASSSTYDLDALDGQGAGHQLNRLPCLPRIGGYRQLRSRHAGYMLAPT